MAHRRDVGASERRVARTPAGVAWQGPEPQRRDRGLPVREDDQRRRGAKRGYDGGKKVRGRKRHLLVDTEGLVLGAKVHSAKVHDEDGIKLLLESARIELSRLKHLWVDAGYRGRGRRWAEETLGLSVEVVRKPPKPVPEKVAKVWAEEWTKEGKEVDWQRLMPPRGFRVLPRRWVVERTFAWISHNRRMGKDYERLCTSGEAFVYAAMTRLMVRRLARAS